MPPATIPTTAKAPAVSGASIRRSAATSAPSLSSIDNGKPLLPRRVRAIDASAGETVRPNPNSAAVWHYTGFDANGDGKLDFDETMHRTISMAAIKDGLLVIADIAGLVHCLDAKTGKVHWTHDLMSPIWGSPCLVDGQIYLGHQDGDVAVFELSDKPKLLATNAMGSPRLQHAGGGRRRDVHRHVHAPVRHLEKTGSRRLQSPITRTRMARQTTAERAGYFFGPRIGTEARETGG